MDKDSGTLARERIAAFSQKLVSSRRSVQRSVARRAKASTLNPAGTWTPIGGSNLGETFSEADNRTITTFFACIEVISQAFASLPFSMIERSTDKDGLPRRKELPDDTIQRMLSVIPNPTMTAYTFWELMIRWRVGSGMACAVKQKNRTTGKVERLWPIHPSRLIWKQNGQDDSLMVAEIYNNDGTVTRVPEDQIFKLISATEDGRVGMDVMRRMRNTLKARNLMDRNLMHVMQNRAVPQVILECDEFIDKQAKDDLREQWASLYGGVNNAGKTAILDNKLKAKTLSVALKDLEQVNQQRFSDEEICRALHVPPEMVGLNVKAQGLTSLDANESFFVNQCLSPIGTSVEQEIRRQLMNGYADNIDPHFEFKGRLKGDLTARANWHKTLANLGVITPNEIRAAEDMNPIDSPNMNIPMIQGAFIPITKAGTVEASGVKGQSGDNQTTGAKE